MNSRKKLIMIIVIIVVILVVGMLLWKGVFLRQDVAKVPVSTSSGSFNTPNMYNPNNGALLKPGEIVQITGTNNYVTQGQTGVWSK